MARRRRAGLTANQAAQAIQRTSVNEFAAAETTSAEARQQNQMFSTCSQDACGREK
ncbi:hypothetical protein [Brevibacillus dissolubilis]|uniref:hypothetical protein n=1 Tax=Brevibacillus dissolubilis TaxID=1844116 RepID=UPI00159B9192|nr:hypothetical protein [Brevibacillus dissolubilis]